MKSGVKTVWTRGYCSYGAFGFDDLLSLRLGRMVEGYGLTSSIVSCTETGRRLTSFLWELFESGLLRFEYRVERRPRPDSPLCNELEDTADPARFRIEAPSWCCCESGLLSSGDDLGDGVDKVDISMGATSGYGARSGGVDMLGGKGGTGLTGRREWLVKRVSFRSKIEELKLTAV